jgi:hypothetical protein
VKNRAALARVSRELVEKFSRRTRLIEQRARDKYKVLEAQARALVKSTNMAFDDTFAHVITEIAGDWDRWKSELGARNRESKSAVKHKARQELVTHWQSEMTPLIIGIHARRTVDHAAKRRPGFDGESEGSFQQIGCLGTSISLAITPWK